MFFNLVHCSWTTNCNCTFNSPKQSTGSVAKELNWKKKNVDAHGWNWRARWPETHVFFLALLAILHVIFGSTCNILYCNRYPAVTYAYPQPPILHFSDQILHIVSPLQFIFFRTTFGPPLPPPPISESSCRMMRAHTVIFRSPQGS